jgi:excisionase family DNA binding protein
VPEDTEWMRVEDIYKDLGGMVPMDTIRSWIRSGKLPAYKPGRSYLVKREDYEKFIRESRTRPEDM